MGALAGAAFTDVALREAWADVQEADQRDGVVSSSVARFGASLEDNIGRLVADLAWGAYRPADVHLVVIPKDDAQTRTLGVPPARDRVVARAVLHALTPVVDPLLGPASYAFRPGLGVQDAVQAVVALREEGLGWVLRTDVNDCFPSMRVDVVWRCLSAVVDDAEILQVVDLLLHRHAVDHRNRRRPVLGIVQGCPLSPMLANLVLAGCDAELMEAGFPIVRYADDIVVVTATEQDARRAAELVSSSVEELGMSLGAEDTAVMSFEEGFTFLGEDFGPRYPVAMPPRVEEPDRKVVYVALQGGRVHIGNGRLLVHTPDDTEVLDVPTGHVRRIVCFGAVGVSAGVRSWALSSDVEIVFASRRGSYLGSFVSDGSNTRVDRLRAQVLAQETDCAREVGVAIVEAKVRKQIVVLQRFGRREHEEVVAPAVAAMRRLLQMLPDARTTEELMGLEGAAAASYFPAYGALFPDSLQFSLRSRRPPMDVANSALSYLYTILVGECVVALRAAGLDPGIGVLHANHENRPSLALDLMEELRPMVVDQLVVEAARHDRLTPAHGRVEEGRAGVMLTKTGREAMVEAYERRMLTTTRGALADFSGSIRRHLYRQAQRMQVAIVTGDAAAWTGLTWR